VVQLYYCDEVTGAQQNQSESPGFMNGSHQSHQTGRLHSAIGTTPIAKIAGEEG